MTDPQTALTVPGGHTMEMAKDIYADAAAFTQIVRVAKMFAMSPLVPDHLRKGGPDVAIANCTICLVMARELGENPIVVMQNIHFVNGKFGWASQYMIARTNRSAKFKGPLNWRKSGKGDSLELEAYATLPNGEEVSFTVSMAMAKAEGWTKNPKYQTMPEVMLRYRSAAFLVRFYCPEVMLGYHTVEELEDTRYAAPAAVTVQIPQISETATPAPAEPAYLADLQAALDAYCARHAGEIPDWCPDLAEVSEADASRLLDRFMSAEEADKEREAKTGNGQGNLTV